MGVSGEALGRTCARRDGDVERRAGVNQCGATDSTVEQGPEVASADARTGGTRQRESTARCGHAERREGSGRGDAARLPARETLRRVERHEEGNAPGRIPGPDVRRWLAGEGRRGNGESSRARKKVATPTGGLGKADRASGASTLARVQVSSGSSKPGFRILGSRESWPDATSPVFTSDRTASGRARE